MGLMIVAAAQEALRNLPSIHNVGCAFAKTERTLVGFVPGKRPCRWRECTISVQSGMAAFGGAFEFVVVKTQQNINRDARLAPAIRLMVAEMSANHGLV